MSAGDCPRCDAPRQAGNFCTGCGYDLRPPDPPIVVPRHRRPPPPRATIMACPACGAANAGSRARCARCGVSLREGVAARPSPDSQGFGPPLRADRSRAPRAFVVATVAVGLSLAAVLGTVVAARGLGPFGGAAAPTPARDPVEATVADAATVLPAAGPERLLDGDAATAWVLPGPPEGQWVEIELARPVAVERLLVWNGDQRGERFVERNRVRGLRIALGGRRFSVELLDVQGPQVVALPQPVRADRLRLTVTSVHHGGQAGRTALAEIEIYDTDSG